MPTAENPVAVITGGSSGIGLAAAKRLASIGYRLLLVGRSQDRLDGAAHTLREQGTDPDAIHTHSADLSDAVQASALIPTALEHFGRLDLLFNNAGYAPNAPIAQHTDALIHDTLNINTLAPALTTTDAWRHFLARRDAGDTARRVIIHTSSIGTESPFPGFFAYAASKAAVELFARSVAVESDGLDIYSFAVAPGAVETPLLRNVFSEDALPKSATLSPDDVAQVVQQCAQGDHDARNGSTIYIEKDDNGNAHHRFKP